MRVNDWVPQVRSVARDLVMHRIRPDYAQPVAAWLSLVLRLRYAGRDDHSTIIEAVSALLASPEAREGPQEGLSSQDQVVTPRTVGSKRAMSSMSTRTFGFLRLLKFFKEKLSRHAHSVSVTSVA